MVLRVRLPPPLSTCGTANQLDAARLTVSCLIFEASAGSGNHCLAHGFKEGDEHVFAIIEIRLDLFAQLNIWRHVVAIKWLEGLKVQEGDRFARDSFFAVTDLVVIALDEWNHGVVGSWAQLLQLLAGEDINGHKVTLGVAVLSGLGGGNVNNLARAALDNNVTSLADLSCLEWVGGGGASISLSVNSVFISVRHVGCCVDGGLLII